MNTQELFDKVAGHLLAQGERSLRPSGGCAYRGMEGRMCAVGCLIDGDHYDKDFEGMCSDDQEVEDAIRGSIGRAVTPHERGMLRRIQSIHDNDDPEIWAFELEGLAHTYNLQYHGEQYGQQPVGS